MADPRLCGRCGAPLGALMGVDRIDGVAVYVCTNGYGCDREEDA